MKVEMAGFVRMHLPHLSSKPIKRLLRGWWCRSKLEIIQVSDSASPKGTTSFDPSRTFPKENGIPKDAKRPIS